MDIFSKIYECIFLVAAENDKGSGYTLVKMHGNPNSREFYIMTDDFNGKYDVLYGRCDDDIDITNRNLKLVSAVAKAYIERYEIKSLIRRNI